MNTFILFHLPRLIAYAIGFPASYLAFSWLIPESQFTSNDALLLASAVIGIQAATDLVTVISGEGPDEANNQTGQ